MHRELNPITLSPIKKMISFNLIEKKPIIQSIPEGNTVVKYDDLSSTQRNQLIVIKSLPSILKKGIETHKKEKKKVTFNDEIIEIIIRCDTDLQLTQGSETPVVYSSQNSKKEDKEKIICDCCIF